MVKNVFELESISKTYRNDGKEFVALEDVNLSIREGEIFGIIGMSGAGKSTLVGTSNRLEEASAGTVKFYGSDLASLKTGEPRNVRHSISMIFQSLNLLQQRTVVQNVKQPLRIAGVDKVERREIAEEMLAIVGLSDKKNAYPERLSGGQKQGVAIVRALATDPKVLLCDEATSASDPKTTGEVLGLLKEINEKRKLTIVIITHEMSVAGKICDRVAIIDNGKLAEIGEVKGVFRTPQSKVARKLVFPANPFDPSNPNGRLVRIALDGLAASEPSITNFVEMTGKKVNILSANTKSVGGIGHGQMVLELPPEVGDREVIIDFLKKSGLSLSEVVRK